MIKQPARFVRIRTRYIISSRWVFCAFVVELGVEKIFDGAITNPGLTLRRSASVSGFPVRFGRQSGESQRVVAELPRNSGQQRNKVIRGKLFPALAVRYF